MERAKCKGKNVKKSIVVCHLMLSTAKYILSETTDRNSSSSSSQFQWVMLASYWRALKASCNSDLHTHAYILLVEFLRFL